jgi:very-short-patch-repair endonuclease
MYNWQSIKNVYDNYATKEIISNSLERGITAWTDPYFYNWNFTPIEEKMWGYLRTFGPPMYPQYPVAHCFIDFANPLVKVGIEADGKDWHDRDKDRARDKKLASIGWTIYRLKGSTIFVAGRDYDEDIEEYQFDPILETLQTIREKHFEGL